MCSFVVTVKRNIVLYYLNGINHNTGPDICESANCSEFETCDNTRNEDVCVCLFGYRRLNGECISKQYTNKSVWYFEYYFCNVFLD